MPKQQPRIPFVVSAQLLYTDITATKLFTLPRGARLIRLDVDTEATSTSATLKVGTALDDNAYIDALDISAVGVSNGALLLTTKTTGKQDIYGIVGGSPSSGGPYTVFATFVTDRSRGPK